MSSGGVVLNCNPALAIRSEMKSEITSSTCKVIFKFFGISLCFSVVSIVTNQWNFGLIIGAAFIFGFVCSSCINCFRLL